MIQEYRQKSAEALGVGALESKDVEGLWYMEDGIPVKWQPDKDANQMLMVWGWLTKNQKCSVVIFIDEISTSIKMYDNKMIENAKNISSHSVESILIATMKAFMEYINNK